MSRNVKIKKMKDKTQQKKKGRVGEGQVGWEGLYQVFVEASF